MNDLFEKTDRELLLEIHAMLTVLTAPKKKRAKVDHVNDADFDAFYDAYPRKVARKAALDAWRRMKTAERIKALQVVDDYATAYANKELGFIPHPATWLNQKRFEDKVEQAVPVQVVKLPRDLNELVTFARQRGIDTRPGESEWEFRQRIEDSL